VGPVGADGPGTRTLRIVTRFDSALGSGRPEEVVAAIGGVLGVELAIAALVRENLILADPQRALQPARPHPRRGSSRP